MVAMMWGDSGVGPVLLEDKDESLLCTVELLMSSSEIPTVDEEPTKLHLGAI